MSQLEKKLAILSRQLTNLFPLWILLAAIIALQHPPAFTWFTPHITNGLAFVMLGTGLTLTLSDMGNVFTKMPQLLLLGMTLQYTVLPCLGFLISRGWGLETGLAAGVALVSCCPGGSASNIVAYIAGGEMALSILMTTASTLAAIITLPLLTSMLLGTMVSVDPMAMLQSTVQVSAVLYGPQAAERHPHACTPYTLHMHTHTHMHTHISARCKSIQHNPQRCWCAASSKHTRKVQVYSGQGATCMHMCHIMPPCCRWCWSPRSWVPCSTRASPGLCSAHPSSPPSWPQQWWPSSSAARWARTWWRQRQLAGSLCLQSLCCTAQASPLAMVSAR